ncbi:Na(+)/H(+) antiporter subunit F1 [Psychrobacillus psychrodurans]|jgi:multicomponent Na+:H+ antiporter subunit F|uniref:Na(+)/H(+) antiporter subunit F1 n=1 Tax=Psychrobacillus psychrodurans TaxID=126157 RepID=A0A9X3LE59_9BACI|nr:Na(+)/H(+) antiporter subunit F1 [Psychrobacillus psychrodurans]MCZ8535206.1 Na(+)/H(+) antiporter subunit F1 [Psychrobacillus psychrodurans]
MTTFLWIIVVLISLSILGFVYRLVKGPSTPDRVIALDAIGVGLITLIGLISILFDTVFFLEVILLLAVLSFIGTVAFSKFTEKGEIIQRDRNS